MLHSFDTKTCSSVQVGLHQRRFEDGTALARESVASKRRESKEKLEARVRRKSEKLNVNG